MDKAWRSPSRPASEDCSPPADRHDISTDRVPRLLRIRLGSAPRDALRREALLLVHGLKGRDPPGYIPSAEVKRVAVRSRRLLMRDACLLTRPQVSHDTCISDRGPRPAGCCQLGAASHRQRRPHATTIRLIASYPAQAWTSKRGGHRSTSQRLDKGPCHVN